MSGFKLNMISKDLNSNQIEHNQNRFKMRQIYKDDEENENINLHPYEILENEDLDNIYELDKINEEEEKNFTEKEINQYEENSGDNLFSKKTTKHSKKMFHTGQIRDIYMNLNIVKINNNNDSVVKEKNKVTLTTKENLIKHILALDFKKGVKNYGSYSSRSMRRSQTTEEKLTNKNKLPFGERLYYKGLAIKEKSVKNLHLMKIHINNKEMKECTFRPKLCESSIITNLKACYSGKMNNKNRTKIINQMTTNYSATSRSSQRVKTEIDFNKITQTSRRSDNNFWPYKQTNESTRTKRTKTEEELIQHSTRLYNDALKIKLDKEKLKESFLSQNYPFHPKINDISKPNINKFFSRLQKWVDRRNEKYEIDIEKTNYDDKTGLRLFSPKVNEQFGLNENNKNKFIQLHEEWKRREAKGQQQQEQYNQGLMILSNLTHVDPKSRELSNELIKKIFSKIFELLVDTHYNVINGQRINLDLLPDKIKKIVNPLIQELKEQKETLTETEFIVACKHLYNYLPSNEKQSLFEWYFSLNKKKEHFLDTLTFKPTINRNSEKIVKSTTKFASNFYLKAMSTLENKEKRLETEESNNKNLTITSTNKTITKRFNLPTDYKTSNYTYSNSYRKPRDRKTYIVDKICVTDANQIRETTQDNM